MEQLTIDFNRPPHFAGADYIHSRDARRLSGQMLRVFNLMRDGQWRSLAEIAEETGDPPASVSAQLRHLKKKRFGEHGLGRKYAGRGLYFYRLIPAEDGLPLE